MTMNEKKSFYSFPFSIKKKHQMWILVRVCVCKCVSVAHQTSPPPIYTDGRHLLRRDFFIWILLFLSRQSIGGKVVSLKSLAIRLTQKFRVMNCVLEWPDFGERNSTETASRTVGYWPVCVCVCLGIEHILAAVALVVTEGKITNKKMGKMRLFFSLTFSCFHFVFL